MIDNNTVIKVVINVGADSGRVSVWFWASFFSVWNWNWAVNATRFGNITLFFYLFIPLGGEAAGFG